MRGGYHAYKVRPDMVINEEQQGRTDDDIIELLKRQRERENERREKLNQDNEIKNMNRPRSNKLAIHPPLPEITEDKDELFGIDGEVSKKRNNYKQWKSWILDERIKKPIIKARMEQRGDDFLRKGSYNDLYWDLESIDPDPDTTQA